MIGRELFAGLRRRPALDGHRQVVVAAHRQRLRHPRRRDLRQCVQTLEQPVEERDAVVIFRIRRGRQGDAERQDVVRAESRIDVREPREAAEQQRGADEQHDRQRHLRDEQAAADPAAAGQARGSPAFLERFADAPTARLPRRRQPEEQPGQQRDGQREAQDRRVDRDVVDPRDAAGAQRPNRPDREVGEQQAERASGQRQDQALTQHLKHQTPASRAERGADGDFLGAHRRADQQQVGHVRAGDQDQDADGRHQRQEGGAAVADHLLVQGHDLRGLVGALPWILLPQALGDRLHLGLGLLLRHARLQSGDHAKEMTAAAGVGRIDRDRRPELHLPRREIETWRHHSDDRRRSAVQRDRLAEDVRVGGEPALPHAVAQHDHVVLARRVFFGPEASSQRRADLQQLEHIPGHRRVREPLGPAGVGERRAAARVGRDPLEHGVLLAPVQERRGRDREAAVLRHDLVDAHQRFRIGIRQRPEEHAVDDAEHRAGGADPERQRQDRDRGEPRALGQLADRIPRVPQHVSEHMHSSLSRSGTGVGSAVNRIGQSIEAGTGMRPVGQPARPGSGGPSPESGGRPGRPRRPRSRHAPARRDRNLRAAPPAPARCVTRARA